MSGQELYEVYVLAHYNRNCIVDSWDEIGVSEQEVWDAMAQHIGDQP